MGGEGRRESMINPMDNFPEELATEILSRLPVRSLLRFKCVCKSWCNRIFAKDFTFLHLNNYKPSDLVLAGPADTSKPWKVSIANVSPPTIVDYPLPQQQDFDKSWAVSVPDVCGPCNGIFCLYRQGKESILLWNPQIQDFKIIPQSNLSRQFIPGSFVNYKVGFAFDSERNDYKILQIVRNTPIYQPQQQQLELYSLATNSWKKLDYASPLNSLCSGSPLFTLYRKIGWLGHQRRIIFLFDVSEETFDMIPISLEGETDSASRDTISQVFPFRESIAVVISTVTKVPSTCVYCEIWALNDFSCTHESRCWSKLWTIEVENLFWPLGFCGNSYLIFRGWSNFKLKLYDLLNHDVVDVGTSMFRAFVYKESLISISS